MAPLTILSGRHHLEKSCYLLHNAVGDGVLKRILGEASIPHWEIDFLTVNDRDFVGTDNHMQNGFATDNHMGNGFGTDYHMGNGFGTDYHMENGFATDNHMMMEFGADIVEADNL